jgi:hypothetical protein
VRSQNYLVNVLKKIYSAQLKLTRRVKSLDEIERSVSKYMAQSRAEKMNVRKEKKMEKHFSRFVVVI